MMNNGDEQREGTHELLCIGAGCSLCKEKGGEDTGGFLGEVLGPEMCFSQFLNQSVSGIFQ